MIWDVVWNVIIAAYVNVNACAQPTAAACTASMALGFWLASTRPGDDALRYVVHASLVSFPGFLGLLVFAVHCS